MEIDAVEAVHEGDTLLVRGVRLPEKSGKEEGGESDACRNLLLCPFT